MRPVSELIVPQRFCGPPDSGNGGWTAGALAALDEADCPDDRTDEGILIGSGGETAELVVEAAEHIFVRR